MSSQSWDRLKEIFDAAARLPPDEVPAYLERECGSDAELRAEVESLLANRPEDEFLSPGGAASWDTPEPALEKGGRLGEYEIERRLGSGGMGVVYLARHVATDRRVALKVLRRGMGLSRLHLERFQREATATSQLAHPGIVQVLDVGREDDTHFFAMEQVEGETLSRVLERAGEQGEFDPDRALRLATALADALHYAHERGVIHRDVKPQNILLDAADAPRIVDFGLAKFEALSSLSRSGDIAGTPYYMSPEQALAKRVNVDRRSDIFSLGVVLYEMLTLHRPFEGETHHEILYGITFRDPPPLRRFMPDAPAGIETVLLTAMAKSPDERYATAAELAADLRRLIARQSVHARRPGFLSRWRRHAARYPRLVTAAVVALAAVAIAAILPARPDEPEAARLSVTTNGPAEVSILPIDIWGKATGEEEFAGAVPLADHPVPPGRYRIFASREGFGFAEATREFGAGGSYAVELSLRPDDETTRGMKLIETATFTYGVGVHEDGNPTQFFERRESIPAFWIDECEVTNREYKAFVDETGHEAPAIWNGRYDPDWDKLPVAGVSYYDARDYAEWAGKRLPTAMEWECATRGADGRVYPWGDDASLVATLVVAGAELPRPNITNVKSYPQEALDLYRATAKPVRSVEAACTPEGLYHTLGNVAEWTETIPTRFDRDLQRFVSDDGHRVTKGMSWRHPLRYQLLSADYTWPSGHHDAAFGFRCAKTVRGR